MSRLPAMLLLLAACGGGSPDGGSGPEAPAPAAGDAGPARHPVDCLPRLPDTRIQARLPEGYTLRDLVLWYGAVSCDTVLAPRPLLSRRAPDALDRVVSADDVAELFRAEVADLGLDTVRRGDFIVITNGSREAVVFTPRRVGEPDGGEESEPEEPASLTGIPACDAYLKAMDAYIACDKVPKEARETMQKSVERMKESWRELSEGDREMAAKGCEQGREAMEQSARAVGCEL